MSAIPLLLSLTLFAGACIGQGSTPQFAAGELADLTCRVTRVEPVDDTCQLLTVEVENRGVIAAEPLDFRLESSHKAKDKNAPLVERCPRAQLPHAARFGRPTPAAGKQSYLLRTSLPGKKAQFTARVASASFATGGDVPRPAITIGKPEQVQRESMVGRFPVTAVELTNPLPHDVDLLLRARFEQPRDCDELLGVRIAAGETVQAVIAARPFGTPYLDLTMQAPGCAIKITKLELVDWILVGDAPAGAAAALLRPAYEAWYRWPDGEVTVTGEFHYREQRQRSDGKGYDDVTVRGRFELPADGELRLEVLEGSGANASHLLRETFATVRRPDFETFQRRNELLLLASDRVAVSGPGWTGTSADATDHRIAGKLRAEDCPDLQVVDGHIASDGYGDTARTAWELRDLDGAQVVVRRLGSSTDTRFSYSASGGRVVPTDATKVIRFGEQPFSIEELTITQVHVGGESTIAPAVPSGDGVAALRTLWDAAYRVTDAPITVEAKFQLDVGDDGVWRGYHKLSGTIVMTGVGRHLRASDCRFDGKFAREDEVQLASVLRDRLGMWYARDFNARPSFDDYFRGAVVHAPDADGTFSVERGPIERVLTRDGTVRGFDTRGCSTRFTWGKVGDRQVVTRVEQQIGGADAPSQQRWQAVVQVKMAQFGDHLLPTKIAFERIFARDWQPETLTFREVRVR